MIEAPQLNCSEKKEAIADKQKGRWYLYQARVTRGKRAHGAGATPEESLLVRPSRWRSETSLNRGGKLSAFLRNEVAFFFLHW